MFKNNRVIYSDNGTLEDLAAVLSDPYNGVKAFTIVSAQDAIYVGSDLPFNNRFFKVRTKNTIAGNVTVKVWDGTQFSSVEDVQDFTKEGGIPFSKSGLIRFTLPRSIAWSLVDDTADVTELASVAIQNCYWVKLQFSAAFVFELEYVGFRFAKDSDLNTYYRELLLPQTMKDFNQGQIMLNWDPVHILAAEEIIRDLRKREIVISPNQILDPETFTDAAAHKLAEMVYSQFGDAKITRLEFAQDKYKEAMAKMVFDVDRNGNGRVEPCEKVVSGQLRRV